MMADRVLLQRKYARVVEEFSRRAGLSLRQALDVFYQSTTYHEMREGISDMHCRSDGYLAEELLRETGQVTSPTQSLAEKKEHPGEIK